MRRAKWFVVTADHNPDVFRLDKVGLAGLFTNRASQPLLFTGPTPLTVVGGEL
jgi:hypothetical protein